MKSHKGGFPSFFKKKPQKSDAELAGEETAKNIEEAGRVTSEVASDVEKKLNEANEYRKKQGFFTGENFMNKLNEANEARKKQGIFTGENLMNKLNEANEYRIKEGYTADNLKEGLKEGAETIKEKTEEAGVTAQEFVKGFKSAQEEMNKNKGGKTRKHKKNSKSKSLKSKKGGSKKIKNKKNTKSLKKDKKGKK